MNDPAGTPVLFSLLNAARALEHRLDAALAEAGLSLTQYGVLTALAESSEPLALSELAARIKCVRSNVTQLVDRLESDGLARRVPDAHDRRSIRAELTPDGRDRQATGARIIARVHAEFLNALGPQNGRALERALAGIT